MTLAGLAWLLALACARPAPEATEAEFLAPDFEPPPPGTYSLPPIQPAVDGAVVDADGVERRLFDYMGDKHVLLSFIYTRCYDPRGCPLATAVLRRVERDLHDDLELAAHVRLVTVSFDPAHDTPEVMRRYKGDESYLDTPWRTRAWALLTTAGPAELEPILEGYGQYVVREIDESGEPGERLAHVLKAFLIDRELRVRNIYSSSFLNPAIVMNDFKTLLMEEDGKS